MMRERSVQHENNDKSMIQVFFLGETSSIGGCFCGFVVPGAPEGSTGRLIFVVVFGEARDRTCDSWRLRFFVVVFFSGRDQYLELSREHPKAQSGDWF